MKPGDPPRRPVFRNSRHEEIFAATGFLIAPIFGPEEVAALQSAWLALPEPIHGLPFSASVMSDDIAYRDTVDALLSHAFETAISVLLDDYRYVFGNFVTKTAFSKAEMPLHQDPRFVDEAQFEAINFWVPLCAVGPDNGCLRVVPGSHRLNHGPRGTDRRFPYSSLEPVIEGAFLYDIAMPPGSACIMNLRLMHASRPNASASPRICASALTAPRECPMRYEYQENCGPVDIYDVDDRFLRHHIYGRRPDTRVRSRRIEAYHDPLCQAGIENAHEMAAQYLENVVIA